MRKLLLLSALALAASSQAAMPDSVYVKADVGPAWLQDVKIKDAGGVKMRFDTGVRADIGVGYQINPCWSVGLESGVVLNSVSRIGTEVPPPTTGGGSSVYESGKADIYQVPLMAKVVYTFSLGSERFKPFIGAGAGGIWTDVNARFFASTATGGGGGGDQTFRRAAAASGGRTFRFEDNDITFGYEAFAGFKYALSDRVDIGVAYKFMGSLDHDWRDSGVKLKTDGIFTHSILAMVGFHF